MLDAHDLVLLLQCPIHTIFKRSSMIATTRLGAVECDSMAAIVDIIILNIFLCVFAIR